MTWTVFETPAARCAACKLFETSGVHALPGEGSPRAQIALLGEAPGEDEETHHKNFYGRAGQMLDGCIRDAGLVRSDLFVANSVRCRPTLHGRNRKPTAHEIDCCLVGSAQVVLADGTTDSIERLVKRRYCGAVRSVDGRGRLVNAIVTGWYRVSIAGHRIVRFGYAGAREPRPGQITGINVTDDHRVLTETRGWQEIRHLLPNERVATGEPDVTPRIAEFLDGALLGDGSVSRFSAKARARFSTSSVNSDFARCQSWMLTPLGVKFGPRKRSKKSTRQPYEVCSRSRAALIEWRSRWYIDGVKRVPRDVRLSPLSLVAWWLGDGSVTRTKPRGTKSTGCIATNGFVLEDVAFLCSRLRALGVEAWPKRVRVGHVIVVSASGVRALSQIIGAYVPPSMRYKISDDSPPFDPTTWYPDDETVHYAEHRVESSTAHEKRKLVYCLDVEGTHNFVTLGGVMHNCRGYALDELREIKPNVIVVLGDSAATAVLGKLLGGVTDNRGKVRWSDDFNAWVVVSFHPAYALRSPGQRRFIVEDLQLAKRVLETNGPPEAPAVTIDVIDTLDKAFAMRDDILANAESIALDWETNGVHIKQSEGFMLSLSIRDRHAYVVPRYLQHWVRAWTPRDLRTLDRDVLVPIMCSDRPKDGFNLGFDACVTRTTLDVWPVNLAFCGQIAHHLLNAHLGERAHSLKICTAMYLPYGRYDDELDQWLIDHGLTLDGRPDMSRVWQAPTNHDFVDGVCVECKQLEGTTRPCLVPYYSGMDSIATRGLKQVFVPMLHDEGVWPLFHDERMPLMREHMQIDRIGVRINVPYLDEISAKLGNALDEIEARLVEAAGPEIAVKFKDNKINPASPQQVVKLLFDELDLPILARTDTMQPSTNEDTLVQLEDLHESVGLIMNHRVLGKIKGTWIDGRKTEKGQKKALRAALDDDGYARMNTRIAGPETLRFATRKPFALHTLPKDKEGQPSVRALVIPDDDSVFVIRDSVQQEFYLQAVLAGQWDVVERMEGGEDVHEIVTQQLGGVSKIDYLVDKVLPLDAIVDVLCLLPRVVVEGQNALALSDGADESCRSAYAEIERIFTHAGLTLGKNDHAPYFFDEHLWLNENAYNTYKGFRTRHKQIGFMIMYRGGSKKLARMAFHCRCVVDEGNRFALVDPKTRVACEHASEAQRFIDEYFERYEQIKWWQYDVIKSLRQTGVVHEVFGAQRKLPGIFDPNKWAQLEAERQGVNFGIQRGGNAVIVRALLGICKEFRRQKFPGRVVTTLHDEIVAQVRRDLAREGDYIVQKYMERPHRELGGRGVRSSGAIATRLK